jgi:hypothetical protein
VLGDPLYGTDPRHDPHDISRRMWLDARQLKVTGFVLPSGATLSTTWCSARSPAAMLDCAAQALGRGA